MGILSSRASKQGKRLKCFCCKNGTVACSPHSVCVLSYLFLCKREMYAIEGRNGIWGRSYEFMRLHAHIRTFCRSFARELDSVVRYVAGEKKACVATVICVYCTCFNFCGLAFSCFFLFSRNDNFLFRRMLQLREGKEGSKFRSGKGFQAT